MAPIYDQVMTEMLKTCVAEDEFKAAEKDEQKQGFSLDSDSEGAGDQIAEVDVNHLDEKAAAVNAIGIICQHSPKISQSKAKEITETLAGLEDYFHKNIKLHVIYAYYQMAFGLMHLNGVLDADDKF